MTDIVERLEKRAKEDDVCADNSQAVVDLLSPELAKFNERDEAGWNTYAVRMAVDHRSSMERDRRYASDLREAVAEIEALRARLAEKDKALEPFAALADIFDHKGGNRPTTGTIAQWSDHRVGDRELTVEALRAARRAREAWGGEDV